MRSPSPAGLAKIAVVERHLATGRIGLGFVAGSGLVHGALASSVAHDAHNLVVVGIERQRPGVRVSHLAQIGGGIVVVDDGGSWPSARSRSPDSSRTRRSPT